MSQNDAVNPHELSRLLELWLIEERTCEKYGLPRPTKKIITSSHVSPASEKASNHSQGDEVPGHAGTRAAFQPTYNADLLARSIAYHQAGGQPANPNKAKHRQSLVQTGHAAAPQPPPKSRPQKQPRVKVDSATGALENEDGEQEVPVGKRKDRPTSGIYIPQSAAKAMLNTASANAAKRTTLQAPNQSRVHEDSTTSSPLPGTSSLLSPSSTLNGSQFDSTTRSKRSTLASNYATTIRSPGIDSHISLEYDSSRSGLSSPDYLAKSSNVHTLDTVLEQGAPSKRGKERLVGRMDLKTGRYVLETRSDSPGLSDSSHLSLKSPNMGGDQSRSTSRQNEHDDAVSDVAVASRIPGEERRANWAEDSDDDEDRKESLMKKLRRRTLGVLHTGGETVMNENHTEPLKQPLPTAKTERSASTADKPQRPAMAQRSSTAPSNVPKTSDVPAPLRIREKSLTTKDHPYLEKSAPSKATSGSAAAERPDNSTQNMSPTKSNDLHRPQFGLFPSTSGAVSSQPDLQRQHSDKSRPEPINRIGQRELVNRDERKQDKMHDGGNQSHFTSVLPSQELPTASKLPQYLMDKTPATHNTSSSIATSNTANRPNLRGSQAPTALTSRAPSHNVAPQTSRGPPLPLLSEAELAKMTPESRALFKQQEKMLRNRLNNTAVNTVAHTAWPSASNSVAPSKPSTAIHTAKTSVVGLPPAADGNQLRPPMNRQGTSRSKAIAVPSMPRLHGRRPSDTPGSKSTPPLPPSHPLSRQVTNATYQSLRPVKSELSLSSRSPSTRSNISKVSQQAPSPQPQPVINAAKSNDDFKSLGYHQHTRTQSGNRPVFVNKLPGLFGPPATTPSNVSNQQTASNFSRGGSVKKPEAPLPAPPADVYTLEGDDVSELDSSLLSAEDGPGPTIEDPRYFAENVLNIKQQSTSNLSQDSKKSGFWRRMAVRKR